MIFFKALSLGDFLKCCLVSAYFGELGLNKQQPGIKEKSFPGGQLKKCKNSDTAHD